MEPSPELLDTLAGLSFLPDVHDGVSMEDARTTLEAMGFKEIAPVRVKSNPDWAQEDSTLGFWYHPKGLALAGWAADNGELYNVRLSAVIDAGWGDIPRMSGVRVTAWACEDGTRVLSFNASLSPESKATLRGLLDEMRQEKVIVGDFGLWARMARKEVTGPWLFCVGNEALESIAQETGLEQWLGTAPERLAEYVRHREAHISGRARMTSPASPWEERLGETFRQFGVRAGQTHPTPSQKQQFGKWVKIGTGETPWRRDWSAQERTGLMLPHVLALMATETRAQDRLLMWCRQAPQKALEQAFATPEQTGGIAGMRFIAKGAILGDLEQRNLGGLPRGRARQTRPDDALANARKALEIICERTDGRVFLGVEQVLEELTTLSPIGGSLSSGETARGFVQDFTDFLEAIHHMPRREEETKGPVDAAMPDKPGLDVDHWEERLEQAAPKAPWGPLLAKLNEWAMDASLPETPGHGPTTTPRKVRF